MTKHDQGAASRLLPAKILGLAAVAAATLSCPATLRADEGGVSFWLPGMFGSLAASPLTPGWTFTALYYHTSVEASGGRTFRRGGNFVARS